MVVGTLRRRLSRKGGDRKEDITPNEKVEHVKHEKAKKRGVSLYSGFLFKRAFTSDKHSDNKDWRLRYFVLFYDKLVYYRKSSLKKVKLGSLEITELFTVAPINDPNLREFGFRISCGGSNGHLLLAAQNEKERRNWVRCVNEVIRTQAGGSPTVTLTKSLRHQRDHSTSSSSTVANVSYTLQQFNLSFDAIQESENCINRNNFIRSESESESENFYSQNIDNTENSLVNFNQNQSEFCLENESDSNLNLNQTDLLVLRRLKLKLPPRPSFELIAERTKTTVFSSNDDEDDNASVVVDESQITADHDQNGLDVINHGYIDDDDDDFLKSRQEEEEDDDKVVRHFEPTTHRENEEVVEEKKPSPKVKFKQIYSLVVSSDVGKSESSDIDRDTAMRCSLVEDENENDSSQSVIRDLTSEFEHQVTQVECCRSVRSKAAKFNFNSPDLDTNMASLSSQRVITANKWVDNEITKLVSVIQRLGKLNDSNQITVEFKTLFCAYQEISDTLVGILIRAKKRSVVSYEGDILLQGYHDGTVITLE